MKDIVQDEQEDDTRDSSSSSSSSSPSSTTDGFYSYNQNYTGSSFSSSSSSTTMLSTDLRLGLTLSSASSSRCVSDEKEGADSSSLMIKVNMEGVPIGRKLDLMNQSGYHTLLPTLSLMFNTPLLCPDVNKNGISGRKHVLTYEDDDGDWMLVGDVPWEMFLRTVKKLRITKPQTC